LKLYSLKTVKTFFGNKNKEISANQIRDFFSETNLYETIGIGNFYLDKNIKKMVYINEDDLNRLCLFAQFKLGGNFNVETLPSFSIDENIIERSAKSAKEFRELIIEHYKSPEIAALIKEQKEIEKQNKIHNQDFSKNIANYEVAIENKKIVAIDFEYNPNVLPNEKFNFTSCSECGVTVLENNELTHYHFIIEDGSHKQGIAKHLIDKFEFGMTETVTSTELQSKLKTLLNKANYLLCHGMETEYTFLVNNGIEIPEMNIEILDTLPMFKKLSADTDLNSYRLKDIVRACGMNTVNLHNAGNDAAYTMLTFLQMNKEPEIIKENIKDLAIAYIAKEKEKIKAKKLSMP
jgi:hypothetical protein